MVYADFPMIRQYELIDKVLAYNPRADVAMLNRAYVFSMKAHGNQKRASGQPYLVHPLEVASVLADLRLDDASVAVGLLHDTLEDTLATYDEIKALFGQDIADLTEGVTKLSLISFGDKSIEQAENFRKLLLAMSKDIRVLLIKLADRLHNMRTLAHKPKAESRARVAKETLEIFVPLADRIGLHSVKSELEELAFKELEPEAYTYIETRMAEWREQDLLVEKTINALKDELGKANITARVFGREKSNYSIHKKMQKKDLTFDQLADIVAYRIITRNKRDCYNVLGLIHDIYKVVPGRFKDYISAAKPNGYQSLHTAVIGPFGSRMEIQIRTEQMHEIAEAGVAAHWLYKEEGSTKKLEENQYQWLKQLVENLQGTEDPKEFYEHAKLELFDESVFVFTPKGDLVALPRGATPLDFAYHIHSDIGDKTQSATINGRIMPLRTRLRNGDVVSINTSKNQTPNPGWRAFVVTAKAKSAINRYLRTQERDEQIKLGRDIFDKAVKRDGYKVSDKELVRSTTEFGVEQPEDAYVAMAQGRLFPRQIFDVLYPDAEKSKTDSTTLTDYFNTTAKVDNSAVGIEGLTLGMSIHMAKCCSPLPGEKIVGIITTGRGVTIHRSDCTNLESLVDQPDRWLSIRWSNDTSDEQHHTARLRLIIRHDPGALSIVSTTVFNAGGNITDINIENRAADHFALRCDIEVKNIEHYQKLRSALQALPIVNNIERVMS